jgi:hypothetical protein
MNVFHIFNVALTKYYGVVDYRSVFNTNLNQVGENIFTVKANSMFFSEPSLNEDEEEEKGPFSFPLHFLPYFL